MRVCEGDDLSMWNPWYLLCLATSKPGNALSDGIKNQEFHLWIHGMKSDEFYKESLSSPLTSIL